ncbi:hypothetical protein [Hyphomonas sp.]|mgnify:CR=1 FL=1|uniref:hypothetical protein n=1 Tax=Hyphomonas sp. TaxID=87 RepID=UPI000C8B963E|nr:hypothetical protein [Hyphomonas sp.]MAL46786.1 hypothetical protein [Hyphomonas sp.]
MADSFLHNHQSALDSQREDDAIQYLQDCGVYPDPNIQESLPYEKEAIEFYDSVEDDKHYPMENDEEFI